MISNSNSKKTPIQLTIWNFDNSTFAAPLAAINSLMMFQTEIVTNH